MRDNEFVPKFDKLKPLIKRMEAMAMRVEIAAIELDTVLDRGLKVNPKYDPRTKLKNELAVFEKSLKLLAQAVGAKMPKPDGFEYRYAGSSFHYISKTLSQAFSFYDEINDGEEFTAEYTKAALLNVSIAVAALNKKIKEL